MRVTEGQGVTSKAQRPEELGHESQEVLNPTALLSSLGMKEGCLALGLSPSLRLYPQPLLSANEPRRIHHWLQPPEPRVEALRALPKPARRYSRVGPFHSASVHKARVLPPLTFPS